MCIIIAKPKNTQPPTTEILKRCFNKNPDGAGFMYTKRKKVYISKGFMTWETYIQAIEKLYKTIDPFQTPIVYHLRITTHGGTNPQNTHPFPLTTDYQKMKQTEQTCSVGIAHNGIISSTGNDADVKTYGVSDTMVYIKKVILPMLRYNNAEYSLSNQENTVKLLASMAGGRLALLDGRGNLLIGGAFEQDNGIWYSNSGYKAVQYSYGMYDYGDWDSCATYKTAYNSGYWKSYTTDEEPEEDLDILSLEEGNNILKKLPEGSWYIGVDGEYMDLDVGDFYYSDFGGIYEKLPNCFELYDIADNGLFTPEGKQLY